MVLKYGLSFFLMFSFFALYAMEKKSVQPTLDKYGSACFEFDDNTVSFETIKQAVGNSHKTHPHATWITTPARFATCGQQFKELGFKCHRTEINEETGDITKFFWLCKNGIDIPRHGNSNTGAGGIVIRTNNDKKEVLLTLVKGREEYGYEVPGGGVDNNGETPEECAIREVKEETGIKARVKYLAGIAFRPEGSGFNNDLLNNHYYFIMKLSDQESGNNIKEQTTEVKNTHWVSLDTLFDGTKKIKIREEVLWILKKYCKKIVSYQVAAKECIPQLWTEEEFKEQGSLPDSCVKNCVINPLTIYLFNKP